MPLIAKFFEAAPPAPATPLVNILELPLDLNFFRSVGKVFDQEWTAGQTGLGFSLPVTFLLGAGLVVYAEDDGTDMLDQAVNATQFFRNESSGKCVPCRIGSEKLVQIGGPAQQARGARRHSKQDVLQARTRAARRPRFAAWAARPPSRCRRSAYILPKGGTATRA